MKIYIASSWRNPYFDEVAARLAIDFPYAYNFKASGGFHWSKTLGPDWVKTPLVDYIKGLRSSEAELGFARDDVALRTSKATVLVLPAGSSAHLELGVAIGLNQYTAIYAPESIEPELMYAWANLITDNLEVLVSGLLNYETEQWSKPHVELPR